MVVLGVFGLGRLLWHYNEHLRDRLHYMRFADDYDRWKRENKLTDDARVLLPVNEILLQLRSGRLRDREQLLRVFAATKKKLDEIGKNLAFLSIDVVDSTGMKLGEEKAAIEHDFREYKRFVEDRLRAHGCLKIASTPDGTMSCFSSASDAVDAAKDLIGGLPGFNRQTKTIRHDFAVRCGVNSGYVYFDESFPLEETSDRVIDIAAHLQRRATTNSLCLTKETLELLQARDGFQPLDQAVLGYEVYEWRGLRAESQPTL
jgi:class 3 adenylate cyclase